MVRVQTVALFLPLCLQGRGSVCACVCVQSPMTGERFIAPPSAEWPMPFHSRLWSISTNVLLEEHHCLLTGLDWPKQLCRASLDCAGLSWEAAERGSVAFIKADPKAFLHRAQIRHIQGSTMNLKWPHFAAFYIKLSLGWTLFEIHPNVCLKEEAVQREVVDLKALRWKIIPDHFS